MARIKIESIIEHLDYDIKRALEDAVYQVDSSAKIDKNNLFRAFVRAVGHKCNTWVRVPDQYIEKED